MHDNGGGDVVSSPVGDGRWYDGEICRSSDGKWLQATGCGRNSNRRSKGQLRYAIRRAVRFRALGVLLIILRHLISFHTVLGAFHDNFKGNVV